MQCDLMHSAIMHSYDSMPEHQLSKSVYLKKTLMQKEIPILRTKINVELNVYQICNEVLNFNSGNIFTCLTYCHHKIIYYCHLTTIADREGRRRNLRHFVVLFLRSLYVPLQGQEAPVHQGALDYMVPVAPPLQGVDRRADRDLQTGLSLGKDGQRSPVKKGCVCFVYCGLKSSRKCIIECLERCSYW